ncbi:MAG TPA: VWA domain-containing protein, partial [Chloroflexota bacterium]|nr:VWA domain-containing protein [Chloroflexota bacterium]
MQKVALGIVIVWTAVLVSFFGYVWWTNNQPMPQEGNLGREVEQVVFWGEGQTAVTITHAAQPNLVCPPQQRAANIVLLLDKSGSMVENGVDGFSEAITAAEAFVETVDLDKTQTAVAFFDDTVYWASEFSQDKQTILENLADYEAAGPTDIANALNEAGELVLTASSIDNTLPVIVLLSDGADDPTNSQRVARRLRDEGVRIVTIALGLTGNAQLDFLEGIATSPNDAYETVPTELQQLYSSIANEFNRAIALNVVYSETISPELMIVPDSQQPEGTQTNQQLQWQLPSMTNEGAVFGYAVSVAGYGRYPLNPEESY